MSKTNGVIERFVRCRMERGKVQDSTTKNNQPFLTDVKQLRIQARQNIEKGALTPAYQGDVKQNDRHSSIRLGDGDRPARSLQR